MQNCIGLDDLLVADYFYIWNKIILDIYRTEITGNTSPKVWSATAYVWTLKHHIELTYATNHLYS